MKIHTRLVSHQIHRFNQIRFFLLDLEALVVTKFPDILIRNDSDVKTLENGDQLEFYIVND